jgi:Dyp-type peroxidase family
LQYPVFIPFPVKVYQHNFAVNKNYNIMPLPFPITLNNPQWVAVLKNLQCNIIKHHGRTHAWHVFFEIDSLKITEVKAWLEKLKGQLKTAHDQIADAEIFKAKLADSENFDGGLIETISFSATGLDKLGLTAALALTDEGFSSGMKKRDLADELEKFDTGFTKDIDCLLIIADDSERKCNARLNKRLTEIAAFATVHVQQKGKVELNGDIGVEHFGYADGISQPLYLNTEIAAQHSTEHWNDAADPGRLLVTRGITEEVIGSYFVFRKLEQDVNAFKEAEKRDKPEKSDPRHLCPVQNAAGKKNDELAGAMVVGRFEDGTPTIFHSEAVERQSDKEMDNDFDYSTDKAGAKCPFHGHVRLTNPRSDGAGGIDFNKAKRITRRGIPYNDTGTKRSFKENEDTSKFTENLGLLFMCYQSSIVEQFEFIQVQWANKGDIGLPSKVGQDGIIGQGENITPRTLPAKWGDDKSEKKEINFGQFVTTKGGEYFFTPAISFLP